MRKCDKKGKGQGSRVKVYVVILVGGRGKRLKPLSSDSKPKAFLSITRDRKTMFRKTVERAKKLAPSGNILVVANRKHRRLVRKDFPEIKRENLLLEPLSRNTAPAITLAAHTLKDRESDGVMVVLPTDQYILNEEKYLNSVRRGIDFAKEKGDDILVLLGVKPKFPSTEYGYIRVKAQGSRLKDIIKIEEFTEKPDAKIAKGYVKSGRYLWNAGTFIFRTVAILKAIKAFAPEILRGVEDITKITKTYQDIPDVSIDYAVMERAGNIYCVKGSYGWRDMGTFESLKEILKRESRRLLFEGEKIVGIA